MDRGQKYFFKICSPDEDRKYESLVWTMGGHIHIILFIWRPSAILPNKLMSGLPNLWNENGQARLNNRWPCSARSTAGIRGSATGSGNHISGQSAPRVSLKNWKEPLIDRTGDEIVYSSHVQYVGGQYSASKNWISVINLKTVYKWSASSQREFYNTIL